MKRIVRNRIITNKLLHRDVLILYKHHFDLRGLIEKKLAIDINTLEDV